MTLAARLRRERTNAASKPNLVLYAPGNMTLPYGKLNLTVGGRGTPGNSPVPGNYANTNPSTPGTVAYYNPDTPGNVANYNPPTGGTYAGRNPGTGGNYAGTNPPYLEGYSYTDYYDSTNGWHDYSTGDDLWSGYSKPARRTYTANGAYPGYSVVNYTTSYTQPGNPYYNPYTPGNPYYNPTVPGTANYNPPIYGTANYNPDVPGNANYNPDTPGTAGAPSYVWGVLFPGGDVAATSPLVGDTKVTIPYQSNPVAISVPPGGSVVITST